MGPMQRASDQCGASALIAQREGPAQLTLEQLVDGYVIQRSARDPRIKAGKMTSAASNESARYTVRAITIEASLDVPYAHLGYGFVVIRPRAG